MIANLRGRESSILRSTLDEQPNDRFVWHSEARCLGELFEGRGFAGTKKQPAVPLAVRLAVAQHHWYDTRLNEAQSHSRRVARSE